MLTVLIIIGFAVFLFIVEWVRVDVVGIIMMCLLPVLGLVTGGEAFIGLSSNAVVSIIAVIIIGAGLDKTGVINRVVRPIIRLAGRSESQVVIFVGATVAGISAFMQNIGAAALFLPAIKRMSKRLRIPLSYMLMPIGFCAILGGTITLVGCSPLILLNDLLVPFNLKPFDLFDVTPIGLALVSSGILYFVTFGRLVLPKVKTEDSKSDSDELTETYRHLGEIHELKMSKDGRGSLTPEAIRDHYLVHLVAIAKDLGKTKIFSPDPKQELAANDDLVVFGRKRNIQRLAQDYGMTIKDGLKVFDEEMSPAVSGTLETVVAPGSELVGKTLRRVRFHERFHANPLAIYRGNKIFYAGLSDIALQPGDTMLLHGSWESFQMMKQITDRLIFAKPVDAEILRPRKAWLAGLCFAIAIGMVIFTDYRLSVCLMTGALGMVLTRVLSIDEAYQSVDWRTIFLLGGLIPLGMATEKTGAAAYIAHKTLEMLGDVPPIVLLTAIGCLSTVFTLVISNVGATVLLVPLVVNMAMLAQIDPRMAALVVGIATSNSFMLPTHQVNALYMGPGGYRSTDFMKAGSIMSIIFMVVMIGMIYIVYGV